MQLYSTKIRRHCVILGGRRGRVIAMATTDPMKPVNDAIKPIQEAVS